MSGFDACMPEIGMIGLQLIYAGVAVLARAAFAQGMSPKVFVVYRQGIGTLIMATLAYLSRRKSSNKSSLGLTSFAWIFLASLIGVCAQQFTYYEGLYLTSSTAASAMSNLVPAVTFVMATSCGLEKLNIRSLSSIAKIAGTVLCVSGAISLALLKGPKLLNTELLGGDNWLLGCLLLFASSCFWSFWLILQVPISASCPDNLYSSAWMGFLTTIESSAFTLSVENDFAAWNLNSYFEIVCCLCAGIGLALSFLVQAWCISQKGPLFSAMFNPLCTVLVSIVAVIFLHEEMYFGSFVGGLAAMIGLYVVLWGKARDFEENNEKNMHLKLTNEESRIVQVIVDESLEKKSCESDLEKRLLS